MITSISYLDLDNNSRPTSVSQASVISCTDTDRHVMFVLPHQRRDSLPDEYPVTDGSNIYSLSALSSRFPHIRKHELACSESYLKLLWGNGHQSDPPSLLLGFESNQRCVKNHYEFIPWQLFQVPQRLYAEYNQSDMPLNVIDKRPWKSNAVTPLRRCYLMQHTCSIVNSTHNLRCLSLRHG